MLRLIYCIVRTLEAIVELIMIIIYLRLVFGSKIYLSPSLPRPRPSPYSKCIPTGRILIILSIFTYIILFSIYPSFFLSTYHVYTHIYLFSREGYFLPVYLSISIRPRSLRRLLAFILISHLVYIFEDVTALSVAAGRRIYDVVCQLTQHTG